MFGGCNELEYLDLSNFNTSNINEMDFMFGGCHKLKEIKGINKFNTSNVTSMESMFGKCKEIEFRISSSHFSLSLLQPPNINDISIALDVSKDDKSIVSKLLHS